MIFFCSYRPALGLHLEIEVTGDQQLFGSHILQNNFDV